MAGSTSVLFEPVGASPGPQRNGRESCPVSSLSLERLLRRLILFAAIAGLAGCKQDASSSRTLDIDPPQNESREAGIGSTEARASHTRMVETLQDLHKKNDEDNPYYGTKFIRTAQEGLSSNDRRANPQEYYKLRINLAQAHIDYGNLETGILQLDSVYRELLDLNASPQAQGTLLLSLGIASLRLAETENCCALHSPESCILPLAGEAIHTRREGSEAAVRYFTEAIRTPRGSKSLRHLAQWLLNLAYMTLGEYPDGVPDELRLSESLFRSELEFPRFPNVSEEKGVATDGLAGGAVADDFDGDGDFDLMVSSWQSGVPVRYFENRGPEGFDDRSEPSGASQISGGLNMVQADYDNDGDVDVLVLRGAWLGRTGKVPNSLLRNEGDGTFLDVTFAAGLGEDHYPTQTAAWLDYDLDGNLDLFVGNESWPGYPAPNQLFRNNGDGTFSEVGENAKVAAAPAQGVTKAVVCADLDNDRWPDIVVSVVDGPNLLYRNKGDGTFEERAEAAGIQKPISSFPAWIWDFHNDGNLDVFISSNNGRPQDYVHKSLGAGYPGELSGHYKGNGRGGFRNLAREHGLDMPMVNMGVNIGDLNNDGFLDMYLGTGAPEIFFLVPNLLFLNQSGTGFSDVTMASGLGHLQKGHAIAFADFDRDGDQDIFEQMGGAKRVDHYRDALYENPGFGNRWIGLKLVGTKSNRSAIGARIRVDFTENGKKRSVYRHVDSGGSFGANPLQQHIGLGAAARADLVEVTWPASEIKQVFRDLPADAAYLITEEASSPERLP